ncbi:UNVERIFIED_ORG: hypothetical protein B5F06_07125 [Lacrimispora saccharolytica]|nr:putative uncharacterized protein [Clostridium sp. CAG:149]
MATRELSKKENVTIRVEPELRDQAAALFKTLGMDLSTATGLFYRQALRYRGIPFKVKLNDEDEIISIDKGE